MVSSLLFCQSFPGACAEGTLPPNSTPLHSTSHVHPGHSTCLPRLSDLSTPAEGRAMVSHATRGFSHLLRDALNNTQPSFELTLAKSDKKNNQITTDSSLLEDNASQLPLQTTEVISTHFCPSKRPHPIFLCRHFCHLHTWVTKRSLTVNKSETQPFFSPFSLSSCSF